MKTQSKLSLYVLVAVTIIAASCKGKPDTGSGSGAGAGTTPGTVEASKKASGVIDSLNITNPDEKKVCALYDEAVSEYIKQIDAVVADTSRLRTFQDSAFDKKFADESKKLKPEMDNLSIRLRSNPAELMKFERFSMYEAQRLMPVMAKYQKIILPQYKISTR